LDAFRHRSRLIGGLVIDRHLLPLPPQPALRLGGGDFGQLATMDRPGWPGISRPARKRNWK
jgi:hypothetical protein